MAQDSVVSDIFSRQIKIAIRIAYGFCGLAGGVVTMARRAEEQSEARALILSRRLMKATFVVVWMVWGCRPWWLRADAVVTRL